jgi:CRP-like cAMP-binding protein
MVNLPLGRGTTAPIAFDADTVIFTEGELPKYLIILKKGQIRIMKNLGQHLQVIKICKENEILNEVSVLMNKPSEFTAIAKTNIELVLVEQKDINSVIKNGPTWIPEIFKTLCERLVSTMEIIQEHKLQAEVSPETILSKEDELKYQKLLLEYKA